MPVATLLASPFPCFALLTATQHGSCSQHGACSCRTISPSLCAATHCGSSRRSYLIQDPRPGRQSAGPKTSCEPADSSSGCIQQSGCFCTWGLLLCLYSQQLRAGAGVACSCFCNGSASPAAADAIVLHGRSPQPLLSGMPWCCQPACCTDATCVHSAQAQCLTHVRTVRRLSTCRALMHIITSDLYSRKSQ